MSERVFAYGSNMCSGRFRDYGVFPEESGQCAVLEGYRLVFNKRSRDGSGKANVERHEDSEVWGVLYSVSDGDLTTLDEGEGRGYRRLQLVVRNEGREEINCWVYVATEPSGDPLRPYSWYKRFLVEGAREHALPPEYVVSLENIEAAEDANRKRDAEKRALGCGSKSFGEAKMGYLQPNLFGVAYASRLFREIENPSRYAEFLAKTTPKFDLGIESHAAELLNWLNKWGCRIAEDRFPKLSSQLRGWIAKQTLPTPDTGIAELEDADIDELTTAYETLRECEFGPTGTAKALFAVRPKSAMAWDEPIRTAFGLADGGGGYRNMLKASRVEAQALLAAAKQYGITDIAKAVGSPDYVSVAKLLDEYHWITITRGHRIPFRNELEMWLSWVPK